MNYGISGASRNSRNYKNAQDSGDSGMRPSDRPWTIRICNGFSSKIFENAWLYIMCYIFEYDFSKKYLFRLSQSFFIPIFALSFQQVYKNF